MQVRRSLVLLTGLLVLSGVVAASVSLVEQSRSATSAVAPIGVASGDLNGDGATDVVAAFASDSGFDVRVYIDADGAGHLPLVSTVAVSFRPDFLGVGDFDADGDADVVAAGAGGRSLLLLEGDGGGRLKAGRTVTVDGVVVEMTTGDLQRADGLDDIAVGLARGDGYAVAVFASPEGAASAIAEYVPVSAEPTGLAIGPLNEDPWADLAIAMGHQLVILHGSPRWLPLTLSSPADLPASASLETHSFASSIESLDFDSQNAFGQARLRLSLSGGVVQYVERQEQHPREMTSFAAALEAADAFDAPSFVSADLDGDGRSDRLGFTEQSVTFLRNGSAGRKFVVNSGADPGDGTCDAGECTLREAIQAANAWPGIDVIEIAEGLGIRLTAELPELVDPVVIDGNGARIDGTGAGDADGLRLTAGSSRISELTLTGFSGDGIEINGRGGNELADIAALGNGGWGLHILNSGENDVDDSTFSGNRAGGVSIEGDGATANLIQRSRIGTDTTGRVPAGNGMGIRLRANGNTVGGTADGAGNRIAYNGGAAVDVDRFSGNAVLGNAIYANASAGIEWAETTGTPAAPELSEVSGATAKGRVRGEPGRSYRIEFFEADGSRFEQGGRLIGNAVATAGQDGDALFDVALNEAVARGSDVTATSTNAAFSTSEFSDRLKATAISCEISWNNASGGMWGTAANWDLNRIPTNSDDVCITLDGTYTVTAQSTTFASTLTVDNASGNVTLLIQGTSAAHAGLFIGSGGANNETIVLDSNANTNATLQVNSGSLLNTGTIVSEDSTAGSRALNASVDNQGTIRIDRATDCNLSSGVITNSGTFLLNSSFSTSQCNFTMNAGTLTAPSALFKLTSGTFAFNGGTVVGGVDLQVSTLLNAASAGSGVFRMISVNTLTGNIPTGQTILIEGNSAAHATTNASASLTNHGTILLDSVANTNATLNLAAGTITNGPGGVIRSMDTTAGVRAITASVENDGLVEFVRSTSFNKIGAILTNRATVDVKSGATLSLSSSDFVQQSGTLNVSATGSFNQQSGEFQFNGGTTNGEVTLLFSTLRTDAGLTAGSGVFRLISSNTLTGNVPQGMTAIIFGNASHNSTTTASASFTNNGTILMDSNANTNSILTLASGTVTNGATGVIRSMATTAGVRQFTANLVNTGSVFLDQNTSFNKGSGTVNNQGTFAIAATKSFDSSSTLTFTQSAGTLTVPSGSGFTLSNGTFAMTGGTISGTLTLLNTTLSHNTTTGSGTFNMTASSDITGDIPSGAIVQVLGTASHHANLTATASLTNFGTLILDSTANTNATITSTTATLTNAGSLLSQNSTAGLRQLTLNVTNSGTLTLNRDLGFNRSGSTFINTGTFALASGTTATFTAPIINLNGGMMNASAGTVQVNNGTVNANGGAVSGTITLLGSTLNNNSTAGSGTFALQSNADLAGNIPTGQTVIIQGTPSAHATATATNGFTINGVLSFDSGGAGTISQLTVTNGTLTNAAGGVLSAAGTGSRTLFSHLDNFGTVNINTSMSLTKASGLFVNRGTWNISPTSTLTVGSGTFRNESPGQILGGGTVHINFNAAMFSNSTIVGNVNNLGDFNAGLSPGIATITGNYTNQNGSRLIAELGGPLAGSGFDQVNISGIASFVPNSTLQVNVVNGFCPHGSFRIMNFGSRSGDFFFKLFSNPAGGTTATTPGTTTYDVTVNAPCNTAPTVVNDATTTQENTPVTVSVLLNDSDPNGDPLTVTSATGALHGTTVVNSGQTVIYTPNSGYDGLDSFQYTVIDGFGGSSTGTVTVDVIPVNDVPVATADSFVTQEDTLLNVAAPGVLANDTDADSPTLTAAVVTVPSHGVLSLLPNGSFSYTPNANFAGTDSFTYRANDGQTNSNVATVTITVQPINDNPIALSDAFNATEDTVLNVPAPGVLSNDSDPEGAALSAAILTNPFRGTVALASDGSLVYTPNLNQSGTDSLTYRVSDGSLFSNTATVTITIAAVNDPPVAVNDSFTINQGAVLTVSAPGVHSNDTDVDSGSRTAVLVSSVSNGTLVLNGNGSFTYTPAPTFSGTDTFTYKANDGSLDSNVATVTITVTPGTNAPVANPDSFTTNEDVNLSVPAPGVLGNDTDADLNPLTAVLVTGPSNGLLNLNANGSFTYSPNPNFNGSDSFTYRASDGALQSGPVTVTITVNPVNDPPLAVADSFTTNEDTALTVPAPGVLGNDSDIEGGSLTASLVTGPSNGTVILQTNGSLVYTPNANFNGTDSFVYRASDGSLSGNATVTITINPVNDPPIGAPDSYSTSEDTPLTIPPPGVLGNDTDIDSATLSAALTTGPSNGTLTLNANGSFTYTPNANFSGTDSFTYGVSDGTATAGPYLVTITVQGLNDPPVAANDAYVTNEDIPLNVAAPGVLVNDSDPDSTTLTAALLTGPANGTLTFNPNGSFLYIPAAHFHGSDSFNYRVSDGTMTSNIATVDITVNAVSDSPVAVNDSFAVVEDGVLTVSAPGVLANDTDVDSPALTASLAGGPANGTVTLNGDGSFVYTPATNFAGTDSFTYRASDGVLNSNVATVTITVNPVNDPPAAVADSYVTSEGTPLTIGAPGVLGNDTDVDSPALQAVLVTGVANGTLNLGSGGNFTYIPAAGFSGTDSFTYRATDGLLNSNVVTVTISVSAVNDAPVAVNDSYTVNEDQTLSPGAPGVLANDSDPDSSALTAVLVAGPANGTLVLSPNGSFVYTPNPNFNGSDSFTYRASDGALQSGVATVSITVLAVNDLPIAVADSYSTAEDTALTVVAPGVLGNDSDVDGNALTSALVTGPANGTLALAGNGGFTYTPNPNFHGTDSFTYRASDGTGNSNPAVVTITVTPVNDPPVVTPVAPLTVTAGTPITFTVQALDADGNTLTFSSANLPLNATLGSTSGMFNWTPGTSHVGTHTFQIQVSDGIASAVSISVTITVNPASGNNPPIAQNGTTTVVEDRIGGARLTATDADNPASLTYSIVSGPSNGTLFPLTGTMFPTGGVYRREIRYTPNPNFHGTDTFTYSVSDGLSSSTATITITVTPVNDAPVLAPIPGRRLDVGSTVSFTAVATDIDGDTITYSLSGAPAGAAINPATGAFSWTPGAAQTGLHRITVVATDNGTPQLSASRQVELLVVAPSGAND